MYLAELLTVLVSVNTNTNNEFIALFIYVPYDIV